MNKYILGERKKKQLWLYQKTVKNKGQHCKSPKGTTLLYLKYLSRFIPIVVF